MADRITLTVDHGIADVRFNRPDKLNAFDRVQIDMTCAMIARLGAMADLRCVVLSGEGRAFSVGIDLALLSDPALHDDLIPRTHGAANRFQQIAWGWRELPVPVIAAVHGFAFGAAFQVALGADIRVVSPDAELSMMEVRWGLVPDVAGIALLRAIVPTQVARDITYTGRRVGGPEAAALGLANHLANDPRDAAMRLARSIAANAPDAIRAAKRLFNLADDASATDLLLAESREQMALLASSGHREALRAAAERRAPLFENPQPGE
jgi:enoyl-CoA hydratase/carnithine racemase